MTDFTHGINLNMTPRDYIKQYSGRTNVIRSRGGGVTLVAERGKVLQLEEIAAKAPAVFANDKHDSRSERFEFTDTKEILSGMIDAGFYPVEVRQGGSRIEGKKNFTKHMVRFAAAGDHMALQPKVGDITRANIIWRTAHDGTSSNQLNAGFLRLICLNGMETNDEFSTFRVGHVKGSRDKVIDAAFEVIKEVPMAMDQIKSFAGLNLTPQEQMAFAKAALQLRWDPNEIDVDTLETREAPIPAEMLLAPKRTQDLAPDLWTTMNRVQENLIRGGQSYRTAGERPQNRTVGRVNSIDQDSKINRALWTLTREMEALKAA